VRGATPGRLEGAGTPFDWPQAIGFGRQPYASLVAGAARLTAAATTGVAAGQFGWADPVTGQVANVFTAGWALGFVLPPRQWWNWQRAYTQRGPFGPPQLILRPGTEVIVAAAGDFLTLFPFGAQAGNRVYADPATGYASSGNPGTFIATPWTVMASRCECNARVRISSFTAPLN
jgi:hypothetical protein